MTQLAGGTRNGKEIFFSDITGVELILLMEEMDAVVRPMKKNAQP